MNERILSRVEVTALVAAYQNYSNAVAATKETEADLKAILGDLGVDPEAPLIQFDADKKIVTWGSADAPEA